KTVLPAKPLLLNRRTLGLTANILIRIASDMGFAEGVSAGDQRDRLLVVHRHPRKRLANVPRRSDRIRIAVRSLRIDVNQTHLHSSKRVFQLAIAAVSLVTEPRRLGSPIRLIRLPRVRTSASEAVGLEPHRLQR